METLAAVGLVGNVIQIVQGVGSLLSLAQEFRKCGSPSSLSELRNNVGTFTRQATVLRSRLETDSATRSVEDQGRLNPIEGRSRC